MNSSQLSIRDLLVHYPGLTSPVVNSVSFEIPDGKITALVGPSGCGKSTVLKTIAGIVALSNGTISIGRTDITEVPAENRRVGYVPQSYGLFPHMTVVDNVGYGIRFAERGVSKRAARKHAKKFLELTRVNDLRDRFPSQLSGGQRQRVALARAIAFGPQILLLDEPLSALDPSLREGLRTELASLVRATGLTTLIVTHDQQEAFALADHMIVMNAGNIVQTGTPNEIWRCPTSAFAATFVAAAKLLPGTSWAGVVRTAGGSVPHTALTTESFARLGAEGSPGVLAICPTSLILSPDPETSPLVGQISKVQFAASRQHVCLVIAETELTAEIEGDRPFTVGLPVGVSFLDRSIHWFPA